ncbi:hypothetical protein [Kaistella jeonii]|uniref:Uncharacterized protein n=1 Tax=Kaistella jeonii TaxID=266749 RepID=A0A0C1F9R7_9FLAO|nr:hypothetical protein [Kaistella jeonii]KIA89902.1 hypothetical protein OA86_04625 [Kaistella jeonii]SFB81477.1 hypothetical protein SAMN05421876_102371 [Kaistella jeonii]VEI96145.1 Uncharacterised protein [Kaistella jeonii]
MSKRKIRTALIFSRQNQRFRALQKKKVKKENVLLIIARNAKKTNVINPKPTKKKLSPHDMQLKEKGWSEMLDIFEIKSSEVSYETYKKRFNKIPKYTQVLDLIKNAKKFIELKKLNKEPYRMEEFFKKF